jgi:hypothetical protein
VKTAFSLLFNLAALAALSFWVAARGLFHGISQRLHRNALVLRSLQ